MRLTIVGSSGSMSGPGGAASGYLVQAPDATGRTWSVLLDIGPGAFGQLMNHLEPRQLDALILSHLHPDHMVDVTSLHVFLRYHPAGELPAIRTVGPVQTAERIGGVCWLSPEEVARQFDIEHHEDGRVITVGPLRIEAFAVRHPVPAFGVRIDGPSEVGSGTVSLAYTGDTDSCAAAARLADGVDLLLAEASFQEGREDFIRGIHLTGLRAGRLAAGTGDDDGGPMPAGERVSAPVGRLVLTHLPPWTDADVVTAEARRAYDGPVDVATPGASWTL
jgi:ribonuclease BN (tRNA processing enzyme)